MLQFSLVCRPDQNNPTQPLMKTLRNSRRTFLKQRMDTDSKGRNRSKRELEPLTGW